MFPHGKTISLILKSLWKHLHANRTSCGIFNQIWQALNFLFFYVVWEQFLSSGIDFLSASSLLKFSAVSFLITMTFRNQLMIYLIVFALNSNCLMGDFKVTVIQFINNYFVQENIKFGSSRLCSIEGR